MPTVGDILQTLAEGKDAIDIVRAALATANATTPEQRVDAVVKALAEIAEATKTDTDDKLHAFIAKAASGTNCSHELKDLLEAFFK